MTKLEQFKVDYDKRKKALAFHGVSEESIRDEERMMTIFNIIENIYNYEVTDDVFEEVEWSCGDSYKQGKYCYMAMVLDKGVRRTIAVAYNLDYCLKKAYSFVKEHPELVFTHINKVLWGETKEEKKIFIKNKQS